MRCEEHYLQNETRSKLQIIAFESANRKKKEYWPQKKEERLLQKQRALAAKKRKTHKRRTREFGQRTDPSRSIHLALPARLPYGPASGIVSRAELCL